MIVCNKHPRRYVESHCTLQERAADCWVDAQRNIDGVGLVLIDRDDPTHIALALVGLAPEVQRMILSSFEKHLAMRES